MRALARLVAVMAFLVGLGLYSARACADTRGGRGRPLLAIDVHVIVGAAQ